MVTVYIARQPVDLCMKYRWSGDTISKLSQIYTVFVLPTPLPQFLFTCQPKYRHTAWLRSIMYVVQCVHISFAFKSQRS